MDLREKDDYELYHIKEGLNHCETFFWWSLAIHFPGPAIARDKFPKELFARVNKKVWVYNSDLIRGTSLTPWLLFTIKMRNIVFPMRLVYLTKALRMSSLYLEVYSWIISDDAIIIGIEAFFEEAPDLIEGRCIPLPLKRSIHFGLCV